MSNIKLPVLLTLLACMMSAGSSFTAQSSPEYTIEAIRFGTLPQVRAGVLLPVGAKPDERFDIAVVIWLIRGNGRNILFDTGYHRQTPGFTERWNTSDYVRPDEAVKLAGVQPEAITDIIVSHVHWDHMGSLDLFPQARVWIQKDEYQYYTGPAFQPGGKRGGELEDLLELVKRNAAGKVTLVDGDDREILPGIRVYTGARHTYASQYVRVAGNPTYVLASDNCYLYRNLDTNSPIATFDVTDRYANVAAFARMIQLAGAKERVVPGHDMQQFERFPTKGRIAKIK